MVLVEKSYKYFYVLQSRKENMFQIKLQNKININSKLSNHCVGFTQRPVYHARNCQLNLIFTNKESAGVGWRLTSPRI